MRGRSGGLGCIFVVVGGFSDVSVNPHFEQTYRRWGKLKKRRPPEIAPLMLLGALNRNGVDTR